MNAPDFREIARHLTDRQLALALQNNGWQKYGGQENLYSRWRPISEGGERVRGVLLPQDAETEDYFELLSQAVAQAWKMGDGDIRSLLERAATLHSLGDEVKFHKETRSQRGTIPWTAGEDLHAGAQKSMVVGAKTRKSKAAYFGNANYFLAKSFLDSVLMGQTEVGSYVITAYVPPEEVYTERKINPGETMPLLGRHTGREITLGMVDALSAARESVDHFKASGSTHGFVENVRRGFCYELTQAVRALIRDSDGAEIEVELNSAEDLLRGEPAQRHRLEFSPSDYSALETAGNIFAATAAAEYVTVLGAVTQLERPKPGEPGVVRLDVFSGSRAKKMRVRLKVEDYDLAVDAHRNNLALRIRGRQEVEGRYFWLYDPEILELVQIRPETSGVTVEPGEQEGLF
ncbi:hypothetical protein SGFS_067240 [Streptomyces graminofaciens]|uniref:Uncharacterized protein n=1 Tax=Streptomyces graminofaciens TaxID=68212 RepID=A0ABN5VQ24_9ACTN|nr:hypothetical protein [Streptomyces graminofaciens]BBC35430.1 hypothetical protein SGFS_067240 [Streptomyces graminofaciens]